jgi:hypothetical protein
MWRRSGSTDSNAATGTGFGVGVQVVVHLDRSRFPDSELHDPIGVIVAPGEMLGSAFFAPVSTREPIWEVQFDEPFFGLDGSGPHDSVKVPESLLSIAPEA